MDLSGLIAALREPGDDVVCPRGAGTRGRGGPGRVVSAPVGIVEFEPAEMTLRCGAGTPLDELHAVVAERGQELALPTGGTVGGALAVGRSDVLRRGRGPVRDVLLQARVITSAGVEVTAGGPTVKNVSGFDLCRVLVGSWGTLAVMGEVILRTRARPATRQWFTTSTPPDALMHHLHRPTSVLWNGDQCWVCLEGHVDDVERARRQAGLESVDGPPALPRGGRWSVAPSRWREVVGTGGFMMEWGVGVVHHEREPDPEHDPVDRVSAGVTALGDRLRLAFDPARRLNPHLDLYPSRSR
jgi:glycolate oxidase FAD binding subunit